MVSNLSATIFAVMLIIIMVFLVWSYRTKTRQLIHNYYMLLALSYGINLIAMLGIRFTDPSNISTLYVWDAFLNVTGGLMPVFSLCIALTFVKGWEKPPKKVRILFLVPLITTLVVCTNSWHHLQYIKFSIVKSEIIFGPYMMVSGIYSYICLITSLILMITFGIKNRSRLYIMQCSMFALGGICPMTVSVLATLGTEMTIAATPLSFIPTIILNWIAIYQLHILDIKPIATQRVLDWISDCYLVVSDKGLVISYNQQFERILASRYGIMENRYLSECVKEEDITNKTAVYNLLTAISSSRDGNNTAISYEQAITIGQGAEVRKNYYVVDVTPLMIKEKASGYVVIFKDVTQLKKSMQQVQESQARMVEQERLASLGQMIGGLAHNLKTPIMSISGCISSAENLVEECRESLGDPDVTAEDYLEIFGEMEEWFNKAREASAYMSDIISAIKGQASSANTTNEAVFTSDELIKRCRLLMRHELLKGNCSIVNVSDKNYSLRGDINSLVQVLNNLINNAIDSQQISGGGEIIVEVKQEDGNIMISVQDKGAGFTEKVLKRLFREMVTSKGTHGTGLGLYISNAVVRGKFGGTMWAENRPEGGAVVGMKFPYDPNINDLDETVKEG